MENEKHDHLTDPHPPEKTHDFTKWRRDSGGGTDAIISALTQLGAYKVGCYRAFTAIFQGDVPVIIAQATAQAPIVGSGFQEEKTESSSFLCLPSLGLRCHRGNDAGGPSVFDGHRVIRDTRREPSGIREHPLLQQSRARFYVEIPLRDCAGNLIGTYGVLDLNPRAFFAKHDLGLLYTIAESIATHLHNASERDRGAHSRQQLNALLELAEGTKETESSRKGSRTSTGSASSSSPIPGARPIHPHTASVYARASSVLQAAMQADGVMFMDPPRRNWASSGRSSRTGSSDSGVSVGPPDVIIRHTSLGVCYAMGSAFSKWYTTSGHAKPPGTMDEELLHRLLLEFSDVKIMGLTQGAKAAEATTPGADALRKGLLDAIPDASSLIFLPIWKCDKADWLAAMIVWTCDPRRTFKDDDLCFLKAAGNMVVLEITQVSSSAPEKCNFDPLSSLSHELRSPLHGVLGNAELLQATPLDSTQRDMVRTVEACGEMILDSLNCLVGPSELRHAPESPTQSQRVTIPDPAVRRTSDISSVENEPASKVFDRADGVVSPPVLRDPVGADSSPSPEGQRSKRTLHVLIVDDNNINLRVLSTFLQKTGYTFETASDGLSTLQLYRQATTGTATRRFDYVLMDISMPVMDGITASRRLREFERENTLQRSTIIAVTSITCSEMQAQAFAAGMDDYLVKPLSLRQLKDILP
ncbi:hypothetical protein BJY00DRAFT_318936 [Aspergillus carlsbadensis]|nr:hypothetical protein BJY00DRAFT_318936 [Aspergillus carlsbadensis]